MRISNEEVTYVADLSRLEFSEEETKRMGEELGAVLDYVETLNAVDTTNVKATEHILSVQNVFREDEVGQSLSNEEALANAPEAESGCFKVPRVIE